MTSFTELLNKKAGEVQKPKPLPIGQYRAYIENFKEGRVSKAGNQSIQFIFKIIEPIALEDEAAWEAIVNKANLKVTTDVYLTEESLWRLKELLINAGVESNDDSVLGELIEQSQNQEIGLIISHRLSGEDIYTDVKSTFKL
jgi:hypothetical protein